MGGRGWRAGGAARPRPRGPTRPQVGLMGSGDFLPLEFLSYLYWLLSYRGGRGLVGGAGPMGGAPALGVKPDGRVTHVLEFC